MGAAAPYDRRRFLKTTGTVAASPLVAGLLAACGGGGGGSSGPPPLTADEQLALTASQAIDAIASGRVTASAYVATLLGRAKALAGLNTIITLNETGALAAAKKIDDDRSAGKPLPRLAGLPIIVKDNINTKDLPTTGGTPALKNFTPNANAPALQAVLDAGAIIIGKGNMHELAFGITSTNFAPFAGPVKNPYNPAL